jgi:hypothetical protein
VLKQEPPGQLRLIGSLSQVPSMLALGRQAADHDLSADPGVKSRGVVYGS